MHVFTICLTIHPTKSSFFIYTRFTDIIYFCFFARNVFFLTLIFDKRIKIAMENYWNIEGGNGGNISNSSLHFSAYYYEVGRKVISNKNFRGINIRA